MNKETDDQLLLRLLSKKIGPVDMDLVIGEVEVGGKKMIKLNNKRVEDAEAQALKTEADLIQKTKLWKIFTETLRYQAQLAMFEHSKDRESVYISGKFLLHAISTFEHIIWSCQNPLLLSEQKLLTPTPKKRVRPDLKGV